MKCIVLTYHSHNIAGSEYGTNDHVSLAADIELLHRLDAEVAPLSAIVKAIASGELAENNDRALVGITFDDGPVFDIDDFVHPAYGPQRGFLNILRDFRAARGNAALPGLHATSFVIASPAARKAMEVSPASGYEFVDDWLSDAWWSRAIASGLMDIGNHSWDHVHHAVAEAAIASAERDNFAVVDNFVDADRQIRGAADFIKAKTGRRSEFFAYPFGHVNDYLATEYLPEHGPALGLRAAFGTGGAVENGTSIWSIPRVVCGHHWRTPAELERLVAGR